MKPASLSARDFPIPLKPNGGWNGVPGAELVGRWGGIDGDFLHRMYKICTEINVKQRGILVGYSFATEEKSSREESGIEASQRIGHEPPFRQLKAAGRETARMT